MINKFSSRNWIQVLLIATLIPFSFAKAGDNDPLDISIAETPEEFRCEALQINDFDKVNQSMASLKKSINDTFGIDDSCVKSPLATADNQKNLNRLLKEIEGGVSTLRGQLANQYVESLAQIATGNITTQQAYEISSVNQAKAKEAVVLVVGAMKEMNALVEKNPLNIRSTKNCKSQYSSSERLVFGIAEMVEDVSPLLIQAVSRIPGLQELAPVVVGASMISSAITQYAEVAQKRVDINKPENRTAILINTCQLVKTYNKMKLLRGLKDNPTEQKQKINQLISVQSNIIVRTEMYKAEKNPSTASDSQWIGAVDQQNQNYLSLQRTKDLLARADVNQACQSKAQVMELAASVISTHSQISQMSGLEKSLQNDIFMEQIAKYRSEIESSEKDPQLCAKATRSLFAYTAGLNRTTFQILMDFKKARMAKDNTFFRASYSLNFLRSFQDILNKMSTESVFEKLQSSIAKTEALVNQSRVLQAWFGNAKNFYWPLVDQYRNPVMDLMNYHERQVLMFRKPLATVASDFDHNLFELFKYWHKKDPKQTDRDYFNQFDAVRMDLSILNPIYLDSKNISTVSGRSSPHQKACTSMIAMRNNYRSLIEAWNTMKYFCQMLSPLMMEPEVSKDLRVRCMGVDDLVPNSPRSKLSGVDSLLEPVSVDVKRMPIILKKIQELKCEN